MNQNAVVWGASGGIGRSLTERLLREGWVVGAVGRKAQTLSEPGLHTFEADLLHPSEVQAAAVAIGHELGSVDWWIYAAGDILSQPVREMTPETWRRILDINLTGVFLTAHFSQGMLTEKAPLYILGAVSERMRLPGLGAYAAAKAGVEALGDVLRKEMRRPVVVVRPGAVNTPLWQKVPFRMPAHALTSAALADRMFQAYMEGYNERTLDL